MRRLVSLLAALLITACTNSGGGPGPAPTVRTEGDGLSCPAGDHGIQEVQFGWSWCYPGTWKFQERLQPSQLPKGVDATFGVVNDLPRGTAGSGDFGFMIIGTYEAAPGTIADWVAANIGSGETLTPVSWGNATSAVQDQQGRRFAITPHHVVELDVRGAAIADAMGSRLSTWKFY